MSYTIGLEFKASANCALNISTDTQLEKRTGDLRPHLLGKMALVYLQFSDAVIKAV